MNAHQMRDLLLSLPEVTEGEPFGPEVFVYKIGEALAGKGKMFAALRIEQPTPAAGSDQPDEPYVNIKCDPEWAEELRAQYGPYIRPGWHMNKQHWNSILFSGPMPRELYVQMARHAYELVAKTLPKKYQAQLQLPPL